MAEYLQNVSIWKSWWKSCFKHSFSWETRNYWHIIFIQYITRFEYLWSIPYGNSIQIQSKQEKNVISSEESGNKRKNQYLANQSFNSQNKISGSPLQRPFYFVNLCGSPRLTTGWNGIFCRNKAWAWTDQQGAAVQQSSLLFSSCFSLPFCYSLPHCRAKLFGSLAKNEKETTLHNH